MSHAGTIEREILDILLTDRRMKAIHVIDSTLLEEIIERTLETAKVESLKRELDEMDEKNCDLAEKVNELEYKLGEIRQILGEPS